MKKDLVNILACPVCQGKLELTVAKDSGREVITGALYCRRCHELYPIADGIPNLLPPDQR
ncbi:MAG: methytransferase partner Trm112 [Chloroflexi bacterium]|nr:methytransferase partner Trm112 [Chloroflexota bacterium]